MDSKTAVSSSLRLALQATRATLRVGTKVATRVAGEVTEAVQARQTARQGRERPQTDTGDTTTAAAPTPPPAEPAASTPPAPATPPTEAGPGAETTVTESGEPIVAPEDLPDTPLTPEDAAVKTIDDTDEVVAEFAEPGAEDGAGAQIDVGEPWAGYDGANVEAVKDRIDGASAAEVTLIELYEQMHKQRKGVLDAAAKRLKTLSESN